MKETFLLNHKLGQI